MALVECPKLREGKRNEGHRGPNSPIVLRPAAA
jgi:hypothetical protein